MSKKALGRGLPDNIKEREMKAEFEKIIEAWQREGYNVSRLNGVLDLDFDSIAQAFGLFDNDVRNLKDISEIVDMMENKDFAQEIQEIRAKLKEPDMLADVLQDIHELDTKIKTHQTKTQTAKVEKKVDEWKGTLDEGKDELMDLWEQSEQETMVSDPEAVREAAEKTEDPTDSAIEDRLSNLRNRLSKLSLNKSIPLRSDKISDLKEKLNAVGSGPEQDVEKPPEPPVEQPAGPPEEQPAEEHPEAEPPAEEPVDQAGQEQEPAEPEPEPQQPEPPAEEPPAEEPQAEAPEATEPQEPVSEPAGDVAPPEPEPQAAPEEASGSPASEDAPEPVQLTPTQEEDRNEALNVAKEMYRNGDYQKAVDYFDMALDIDPGNSDAIFFKKRAESKLN